MGKLSFRICLSLFLVVALILSAFTSSQITQLPIAKTQAAPNYSGAADEIQSLINNVASNGGWLQTPQVCYDGIVLGQTNVSQLQKVVDDLNQESSVDWKEIIYWYCVMQKFDISINQTTIKAALDAAPMMQNGLPLTDSSQGTPAFSLYDRYMIYAYTLSENLNYQTEKWNLTAAYESFKAAVDSYGEPPLWVKEDSKANGLERYYDEGGQTVAMFLAFYKAGIDEAMVQAQRWWDWTNENLWNTLTSSVGMFYQYGINKKSFECEAGGFNQIIWNLYHHNYETANTNNLIIDIQTRLLSSQWNSPQWRDYVIVHAGLGVNSQTRLQNTITSWAALLGLRPFMTNDMKSDIQNMLLGNTTVPPAWELLTYSNLHSAGMFSQTSNIGISAEATANAACLMMYLSMVPMTGSVAVPIQDIRYEDVNNIIDGQISNINLTSNQLTISVLNPGNFTFLFGSTSSAYNLASKGTWLLTFSSDWGSITNAQWLSPLPGSRIYFAADVVEKPTYTITATADNSCQITPSGSITVKEGDSQSFIFEPNKNRLITEIIINNTQILNGTGSQNGSYTFSNVHSNQNITINAQTNWPTASSPTPTNTPATSTPTQTLNPTPTTNNPNNSSQLYLGTLIAGLGVTAGVVLVFYLRSKQEVPVEI